MEVPYGDMLQKLRAEHVFYWVMLFLYLGKLIEPRNVAFDAKTKYSEDLQKTEVTFQTLFMSFFSMISGDLEEPQSFVNNKAIYRLSQRFFFLFFSKPSISLGLILSLRILKIKTAIINSLRTRT